MQTAMTIPGNIPACLRRLWASISPRRPRVERKSAFRTFQEDGIDYITPMPGAVPMSRRRAR